MWQATMRGGCATIIATTGSSTGTCTGNDTKYQMMMIQISLSARTAAAAAGG
jgi:uncharacterized protein YceK